MVFSFQSQVIQEIPLLTLEYCTCAFTNSHRNTRIMSQHPDRRGRSSMSQLEDLPFFPKCARGREEMNSKKASSEHQQKIRFFPFFQCLKFFPHIVQVVSTLSRVRRTRPHWKGTYTRIDVAMQHHLQNVVYTKDKATKELFVANTIYDRTTTRRSKNEPIDEESDELVLETTIVEREYYH